MTTMVIFERGRGCDGSDASWQEAQPARASDGLVTSVGISRAVLRRIRSLVCPIIHWRIDTRKSANRHTKVSKSTPPEPFCGAQ